MTVTAQIDGRNSRLLVLGSTGKLGTFLRRLWSGPDMADRAIHWQTRDANAQDAIKWHIGDNPGALPEADTVIALWGVTSGGNAALGANSELAMAALDIAQAVGARRVLHCSSAAVYVTSGSDPAKSEPAQEFGSPLSPGGAYGQAKLAMEHAISAWSLANPDGPRSCAMRLANVAGADQLFAAIGSGKSVTLDQFPDGTAPRRSYVAPSDLGRIILSLADLAPENLPAVLNVTGPRPIGMDDILKGADCPFDWRTAPKGALPVMDMSDARLRKLVPPLTCSATAAALIEDWRATQVALTPNSPKGPAT